MATPSMGSRGKGAGRTGRKASPAKRYGMKASEKVERAMHEMKRGELHSGGSNKKVTDPKQAIAIGLSQARRAGGKVPPPPVRTRPQRQHAR